MPVFGVSVRGGENDPSGVGPGVGGAVWGGPVVGGGWMLGVGANPVADALGVTALLGVAVGRDAWVGIGAGVDAGLGVGVVLVQPIANVATIAISSRNGRFSISSK